MDQLTTELLNAIESACRRLPTDCVLLSGGVDSSLLAACYRCPAITVTLKGSPATDARFAQIAAEVLGLEWIHIQVDPVGVPPILCRLMTLKNSFDRGLVNDLPVFYAISEARSRGWKAIASGEGAELLFAGYDFMLEAGENFRDYRRAVLATAVMPETHMASRLGAVMVYPYLSRRVIDVAETTDLDDCLLRVSSKIYMSKVPLRRAAAEYLPSSIAWRERADLEAGSGFASLDANIREFSLAFDVPPQPCRRYWDATHEAMHRIFVGLGLRVPDYQSQTYGCEWCGGGITDGVRHCSTCGAFPANEPVRVDSVAS